MKLTKIFAKVIHQVEVDGKVYVRWDETNWALATEEGLKPVVADMQELEVHFMEAMSKVKPQIIAKKKERGTIIVPQGKGRIDRGGRIGA